MGQSRTATVLKLGFDVSAGSSAKRALGDIRKEGKRVQQQAKDISREFKDLGLRDASRQAADLAAQLDKASNATSIKRLESQVGDLTKELERAQRASRFEAADTLNSRARQRVGAVGDVDTAAQTLGGGLQAVGFEGSGGGLRVAGEVAAVTEGVVQLGAAIPAVVTALGPLAIAIAAIGTAAVIAGQQVAKTNEALDRSIDNLLKRNQDLQTLTTEEAQDKLEGLQAELDAVNQTLFEVQTAAVNATQSGNVFERQLATVATVFGASGKNAEELKKQQADLQQQVRSLTQDLDSGAFAANDAGEAVEQTADELERLREEAARFNDSLIDTRRQTQLFIDTASSSEQIEAQIEALEAQKASIEGSIQTYGISTDLQDEYARQLETINAQLEILNGNGQERIETLRTEELAASAAKGALDLLNRGATAAAKAAESAANLIEKRANEQQRLAQTAANAIIKAEDDIVRIRQQSAQRVTQIETQRDAAIRELEEDRESELAEIRRSESIEEVQALEEAEAERTRIQKEAAAERKRLEFQTTRSLINAAADRNAGAAVAAREEKEAREQEIDERERSELAALSQATSQRLREIDRGAREEERILRTQISRQIDQARQSAQTQIELERQKAQSEINIRQQQIQAEMNALRTLDSAAQQFANNMISAANAIRSAGQVRSSIFGSTGSTSSATVTRPSISTSTSTSSEGGLLSRARGGLTGFLSGFRSADSGAIVDRPGLLRVATGEAVLRPRQLQAMAGGSFGGGAPTFNLGGININGAGMSRSQIKREVLRSVDRRLEETLDMAGIED